MSQSAGIIFLVRHGETEWNLMRRYQGRGDSPLTARGVAQAEAIGRLLRGLPERPVRRWYRARSAAPRVPQS